CAAVIMKFGTDEQKLAHIPAILKGEELWMQFLSEPSGGSDVAGALTTAERDGEEWVLNGSKIWTTGAWWADWGLCLARTNWDVPKHRGLTVFMLEMRQPGIEIHRSEMLNGSRELRQELLADVRVPDSLRVGPGSGSCAPVSRAVVRTRRVTRLRARRTGLRCVEPCGGRGWQARYRLPHASSCLHRWRHDRDEPKRDQRAGPRHAPRARPRSRCPVP